VDEDDLLARVQQRGRLHGRNESRRAVCAVVEALGEFLSARAFHLIAEPLPDDVRRRLRRPDATTPPLKPTCRTFLTTIGSCLLADGPDAAFTARVVLEELNATGRVITPARFAHLVATDLRPLLCARRAPAAVNDANPAPRRLIRVPTPINRPPAPATRSTPAPATHPVATPVTRITPVLTRRPVAAPADAPATASAAFSRPAGAVAGRLADAGISVGGAGAGRVVEAG
jgi:uncharacterized protein (DUF2267 family)